jgi:hypothetical protein
MATMDPGQRGFGRQQRYNIPNLPFAPSASPSQVVGRQFFGQTPGGMRRQGPVDRFDEAVGEDRSVDRKRLLALLMSILSDAGRGVTNTVRGGLGQQLPMGGGQPRQRPPMGGGAPRQRPPMGGGAPRQRPPMGGGQPPVVRMEDLLRALNGRGAGAPQADMPVPQARR